MNRRAVLAVLLLAGTLVLWLAARPDPAKPHAQPAASIGPAKPAASVPAGQPAPGVPAPAAPEVASAPSQNTPAPPPATPDTPPAPILPGTVETDLESVQFTIRDFRTTLRENPVGSNAEITAALLGRNLKQVKFPIPAGSKLSEENELVDRWGTPYFFHQISGSEMEIRSAGPDRTMWTRDDGIAK